MSDRTTISCVIFGVLLTLSLFTSQAVTAQPAPDEKQLTTARQLGADGIAAYLANDFAAADQKLERAYKMVAAPTLALWSARARMKLGRWVEAIERYREAIRLPDAVGDKTMQADARRDAQHELTELQARLPTVRVQLSGAKPQETKVSVDGRVVTNDSIIDRPWPVNPGDHAIVVQSGIARQEQRVRVTEREQKQLSFTFEPEKTVQVVQPSPGALTTPSAAAATNAAAARSPGDKLQIRWDIVGIVGASVGGAALVTSGIAWLVANSQRSKCAGDMCDTQSQLDAYNSARTVSAVSFYAGAALALGGATTWLLATHDAPTEQAHVSLSVGPTSLTVHGNF